MISITINGVSPKTAWGLETVGLEISSPTQKTHYINVQAANGQVDMSDFFGTPPDTRDITTILEVEGDYTVFANKVSAVMDTLHGRQARLKLSPNDKYYYSGRCTVESEKVNFQYGTITITMKADPYRHNEQDQDKTITATTAGVSVTLTAETMPFIPVITCAAAGCTVTYGGHTYDLEQGENRLFELTPLTAGQHTYKIKGSGQVKIHYESGRL